MEEIAIPDSTPQLPHLEDEDVKLAAVSERRLSSLMNQCELIRVHESDFRRHMGDVAELRRHARPPTMESQAPKHGHESSLKSRFERRCRLQETLIDPWRHAGNSEDVRISSEADLILNQVVVPSTPVEAQEVIVPEKLVQELPRVRASVGSQVSRKPSKCATDGRRSRGVSKGIGSPRSRATSAGSTRTSVRSNSRPHSSCLASTPRDGGQQDCLRGSLRMQTFSGPCGASSVWLSLDRVTGEIEPYPEYAASRVEVAHQSGRGTVPLAGMGGRFEDAIVEFTSEDHPWSLERSPFGIRDVQRVQVVPYMGEVAVHVSSCGGEWRFVEAGKDQSEVRTVRLTSAHLVSPKQRHLPSSDLGQIQRVQHYLGASVWASVQDC